MKNVSEDYFEFCDLRGRKYGHTGRASSKSMALFDNAPMLDGGYGLYSVMHEFDINDNNEVEKEVFSISRTDIDYDVTDTTNSEYVLESYYEFCDLRGRKYGHVGKSSSKDMAMFRNGNLIENGYGLYYVQHVIHAKKDDHSILGETYNMTIEDINS